MNEFSGMSYHNSCSKLTLIGVLQNELLAHVILLCIMIERPTDSDNAVGLARLSVRVVL